MAEYKLTVAGLGPGDAGLITRDTWARIEAAEHIILRTRIHPTVEVLDAAGISYETYDHLYEEADDFDELYASIVDDLMARAREARSVRCRFCVSVRWRRGCLSRSCLQ